MFEARSQLWRMAQVANRDSHRWFPATANNLFFTAACMAAEGGEAVNAIKKWVREDRAATPEEWEKAKEEIVDTFTYLLDASALMDFDLQVEYNKKRAINEARFGN